VPETRNQLNDNPDDMLRYTPLKTVWQAESAGVWSLVYTSKWERQDDQAHPIYTRYDIPPNTTIKVNDCPLLNGIHLLAISENGQLVDYTQEGDSGWSYMGEEAESIIKAIPKRNPIDNASEFARPPTKLPVCKQIASK
jgi:hypothetical protein